MSRPVPVLLMAHQLGPGGTERQLTEVARSLDPARFQPHVACFVDGSRGDELREAGVPILRLPLKSFLSPAAVTCGFGLGRYLRERRIQIVHAFDYPMVCFGVPVAKLARTPVVLSSQRADRALNPSLYRRMQRVTDHMVDGIVVNCEAMRRHLMKDERVAPGLIHLCYNAIDVEHFSPGPGDAGGICVIGVVAVLRAEKGLETLLEAFARLRPAGMDLRLVLVGSGAELPRLQTLAASLGITARCTFKPATTDVVGNLRGIDIFVLPSLSEALSNSLMEAMACGCAAVASRAGGNPELVVDGETGLLFEKGDAGGLAACVQSLVDDTELRKRLAAAGTRKIREQFSLRRSVRQMEEIYESFLRHGCDAPFAENVSARG
ncbi:MAG: glycosyltransferase family 4 protein [Bryobacteraceae bacterium]